jgi:NAD kinase
VVGIIANPASRKDIRRLVAFGSVYDNQEEINCISRILRGLDTLGIRQVPALAELYGLIIQAHEQAHVGLRVELLEMPMTRTAQDSTEAARIMSAQGVECIIVLGGEGQVALASISPGMIIPIPIRSDSWLAVGESVPVRHAPAVLVLDGEREVPIHPGSSIEVRLSSDGLRVIQVETAFDIARKQGLFMQGERR